MYSLGLRCSRNEDSTILNIWRSQRAWREIPNSTSLSNLLRQLTRTKPPASREGTRFQRVPQTEHQPSASSEYLKRKSTTFIHYHFISVKMDGLQLRDEAVRDRIRLAEEFLDPSDQSARSYRADIILMLNRGLRRLTVSLDEIRTHNRQLADGLLQAPFDFSQAFDQALKNTIVALPNRPAREASDDVVSFLRSKSYQRA